MRTTTRRVTIDQTANCKINNLPDGVGGSIAGSPWEQTDLMAFLTLGSQISRRAGVVSGAAQAVRGTPGAPGRENRAIALSDGSRITFASVADLGGALDGSCRLFLTT